MSKNIQIISKGLSYLFMGLATIFIIWLMVVGDKGLENDLSMQNSLLNPFFYTSYIALGLAVVLAIGFSIMNSIEHPKQAVKALIIIGVMVLLGVITYAFSGNDFDPIKLQRLNATAELSRVVGASLLYTYIIGILSVLVTIVSSIVNVFK